jgi:hypothetical protein
MLKGSGAMPRFVRIGLLLALFAAPLLALGLRSAVARAQVTTTTPATTATTTGTAVPCSSSVTTPTVSVSLQQVPNRIVNGVNLGTSTRPPALNPNGISYDDCAEDMTLQFLLTACGFDGQNLQVWASESSDCTQPTDRGIGQASICWPVSQGSTGLVQLQGGVTYNIRVQDIVGPQNQSPSPTTMTSQGLSACSAQASFLAVPININFVPLNSDGTYAGQAFTYALSTDMVGPPAPPGVQILDGDTLFVVNWTANTDTDTGGYDVIIDPIPGHEPADGSVSSSSTGTGATTELVCPVDSGMSIDATSGDASSDGDVDDDGALTDATPDVASVTDATTMTSTDAAPMTSGINDAGCYMKTVAGTGSTTSTSASGGMCADSLLSGGMLADAGVVSAEASVVAPVEELDEAGDVIDSGISTTGEGTGGIFNPPQGHIVNPNPTIGSTVTGETDSTYTITGLKNGVTYHVVVSAVDNFGNIGPPSSPPVCDFPAPVNDFWKIYRTDGGQAGGGFCALEAVGAPAGSTVAFAGAGALVIAGLRRRRSKRR